MAKLYAPFMKSSDSLYADICKRIEPNINRQMNVLELACGSGQLSFRLAEKVQLWEATDFSENMIEEAKSVSALVGCTSLFKMPQTSLMHRRHLMP